MIRRRVRLRGFFVRADRAGALRGSAGVYRWEDVEEVCFYFRFDLPGQKVIGGGHYVAVAQEAGEVRYLGFLGGVVSAGGSL